MEIQNIYARARFQAAMEQGLEEGLEKGLEKGLEEGREKVRREGIQTMLRRILHLKFGAEAADTVSAQIDEADRVILEGWMERFATAESLDEIFCDSKRDD